MLCCVFNLSQEVSGTYNQTWLSSGVGGNWCFHQLSGGNTGNSETNTSYIENSSMLFLAQENPTNRCQIHKLEWLCVKVSSGHLVWRCSLETVLELIVKMSVLDQIDYQREDTVFDSKL